jgi:hypothetical protein
VDVFRALSLNAIRVEKVLEEVIATSALDASRLGHLAHLRVGHHAFPNEQNAEI